MKKIDPERIARAARIYASNQEASQALGIAPGSFSRLCRTYEVETPHARKRRQRRECRRAHLRRRLLPPDLSEYETELLSLALEPDDVRDVEVAFEGVP